MLNKIAVNSCARWKQTQKVANLFFHTKICCDRRELSDLGSMLNSKYDPETVDRVLTVLNNTTPEELMSRDKVMLMEINRLRYNIAKTRVRKVDQYRRKVGTFKSIAEILEVDDFGVQTLEKLVESILAGPSNQPTTNQKKVQRMERIVTTPVLTTEERSSINTVTSISIGPTIISWAKTRADGHLLSWQCFTDFVWPKKEDIRLLHNLALKILNMLPPADVYVMEEVFAHLHNPGSPQAPVIFMNIQRLQFVTMLVMLLGSKFNQSEAGISEWSSVNNYFFLRRRIMEQLFKLMVGGEITSSINLVRQMMNDDLPESLQHVQRLTIDSSEKLHYDRSNPYQQEAMGQALLFSMAFIDLAINRNPASLSKLRSFKKFGP